MIYFNNFLYYLLNTFNLYPLYGCLFAIFFTEIYIIYKIITNKQLTRDLKIYNFNLNTLFITIYFVVFIILVIIDCIYNNYSIHLIFYYLPFYFLIHLWISCSSFLKKTFDSLNNIIYERYYLENFVKYINTSDEEDEFIFKYIERHCICFTHDIKGKDFDDVWEKKELIYAFPQIFIYNRRFMRVDNTNVFRNYSTDEEILEETLKETPIY